jgi:hypothetical protein
MEGRLTRIKYHEGYDPIVDEKLKAAAGELGGEFTDRPLPDGTREMSFKFQNDEDLRRFFRIWGALLSERERETKTIDPRKGCDGVARGIDRSKAS